MKVVFSPSRLVGAINAPPSKSVAHRLLLAAGLAAGESEIRGVGASQDVQATLSALQCLGARVRLQNGVAFVKGFDPRSAAPVSAADCRECGSTLRFLIPVCLLANAPITLLGSKRLMERPLGVYEKLCRENGLRWELSQNALTLRGPLQGGAFEIAANVSSQFVSGLLFALPLCHGDSELRLLPPVESRPYIDMTLEALARFGVKITWKDPFTLSVKGDQTYCATVAEVEGDYSNAAFFEALCYLGHDLRVEGLRKESLQGDRVYASFFEELEQGTPTVSIGQCPDLGPVLMALAAAKNGVRLTDTERLAIKESDRGLAMAQELAKLGARVEVLQNEIRVHPSTLHAPTEALCGHNDHRIVMALSVLLVGLGGTLEGAEAVEKSFPEFFDALRSLGAEVNGYDA